MFKIKCNKIEFEYTNHAAAKIGEAAFRGLRKSYSFIYPDGSILDCKFKSPNNLK